MTHPVSADLTCSEFAKLGTANIDYKCRGLVLLLGTRGWHSSLLIPAALLLVPPLPLPVCRNTSAPWVSQSHACAVHQSSYCEKKRGERSSFWFKKRLCTNKIWLEDTDVGAPLSLEAWQWKWGESRQQKAESKELGRTQSKEDEAADKLSLLLVSAREEARGQPCAAHLMYLKAWQYGSVCLSRGGGGHLFS